MIPAERWKQLVEANYSALERRGYSGEGREAIQRAVATFFYAFRIYSAAQEGDLTAAILTAPLNFGAEDHRYEVVIDKPYTDGQVSDGSWNLVLAALATSASANHRALQQHFGKKSPEPAATGELEQAWNILYQVRNAFAHDPFRPTFVPNPGYQRVYNVPSVGISCDFMKLVGQEFTTDTLGGLDRYLDLVWFCIRSL